MEKGKKYPFGKGLLTRFEKEVVVLLWTRRQILFKSVTLKIRFLKHTSHTFHIL